MWWFSADTHCSEKTLLAYADGELSRRKARQVKKHLSACWNCRARLQKLEQQVQLMARAFAARNSPGRGQMAKARNRLFQRVQSYETNKASFPRFQLIDQSWNNAGVAASAAFLMALVTGGVWLASPPGPPLAEDLMRHARQSEGQMATEAVHQRLTVELMQQTPVEIRRNCSVNIWSDEDHRRFALQWKRADGRLDYALWQPDINRELVYRRVTGVARLREVRRSVSLLQISTSENDLHGLEQGLMRWLEGRRWRPIALASDFATFASQEGVIVSVSEEQDARSGRRVFQISARRQSPERTVEVLMQIATTTFRPRLLSIRLISPDRHLELRLTVEGLEPINPAALTTAVFEPDLPPPDRRDYSRAPLGHIPPVGDRRPGHAPGELESILPSAARIASVEMEIRYALHHARACLGEPLQLKVEPSRGLSLDGVVSTQKRKEELLQALQALEVPDWVEIDIKRVGELVTPREGLAPAGESISVLSVSGKEADLYFEHELKAYFQKTDMAPEHAVTAFTNRAVSVSGGLLAQAWALRRLAERYGADEWRKMRLQSRWLLERMVRDHLRALSEQARKARVELQPALSTIGGPLPADSHDSAAVTDLPWEESLFRLFDAVEQIRIHVTGLFAGAGLPAEVIEGGKAVRIKSPQQTLQHLLAGISSLERRLQVTEDRIAEQFSARAYVAPESGAEEELSLSR